MNARELVLDQVLDELDIREARQPAAKRNPT